MAVCGGQSLSWGIATRRAACTYACYKHDITTLGAPLRQLWTYEGTYGRFLQIQTLVPSVCLCGCQLPCAYWNSHHLIRHYAQGVDFHFGFLHTTTQTHTQTQTRTPTTQPHIDTRTYTHRHSHTQTLTPTQTQTELGSGSAESVRLRFLVHAVARPNKTTAVKGRALCCIRILE